MRRIGNLLRGGVKSALSLGSGYEAQPVNAAASYRRIERYYLDLRAKTKQDATGFVNGHGDLLPVSATTLAQAALGWWERHLDGEYGARAVFLHHVDRLLAQAEQVEDAIAWPYDVAVPKYGVRSRWYSAMAQGQAASALVRAYQVSRSGRYAEAAVAAARAMTDHGSDLRIRTETADGVCYEECPSEPSSMILNGWVFALWGLHDVGLALDQSEFLTAFETGASDLARSAYRYDLGWWSRYSLFPPIAPDVAKPSYQVLHADQMEVMQRFTGHEEFGRLAARWYAADTPANRARAVAVKARSLIVHRQNLEIGDGSSTLAVSEFRHRSTGRG